MVYLIGMKCPSFTLAQEVGVVVIVVIVVSHCTLLDVRVDIPISINNDNTILSRRFEEGLICPSSCIFFLFFVLGTCQDEVLLKHVALIFVCTQPYSIYEVSKVRGD